MHLDMILGVIFQASLPHITRAPSFPSRPYPWHLNISKAFDLWFKTLFVITYDINSFNIYFYSTLTKLHYFLITMNEKRNILLLVKWFRNKPFPVKMLISIFMATDLTRTHNTIYIYTSLRSSKYLLSVCVYGW